jgi:hypothetical protein
VQFSIDHVFGSVDDTRKAAMLLRPINSLAQTCGSMRELGAYAVVALIVPGGSLIALSLWAFRHRGSLTARTLRALAGVAALGTGLILPG